jgi:hypothetical protein
MMNLMHRDKEGTSKTGLKMVSYIIYIIITIYIQDALVLRFIIRLQTKSSFYYILSPPLWLTESSPLCSAVAKLQRSYFAAAAP